MAPDYLMFKHGGLEGSHGKALNVHIKPKYEFEKCENKNIDELNQEKEELILSQQKEKLSKTYFVSGHRDITEEEFHGSSTYWYIFIAEEDDEKVYTLFLNQNYFTKEDIVKLAQSVKFK